VFAAGALLGLLLWHVAGHVGGDGFFHLARIQKLLAFGDLSLGSTNEFPDGGLHPGYAFPLWHGFLALVAKVPGHAGALTALALPATASRQLLVPAALALALEAVRRPAPALLATAAAASLPPPSSSPGSCPSSPIRPR